MKKEIDKSLLFPGLPAEEFNFTLRLFLIFLLFPWDFLFPILTGGGIFFEMRALIYLFIFSLFIWFIWQPAFKYPYLSVNLFIFTLFFSSLFSLSQKVNFQASLDGLLLILSYFILFLIIVSSVKNYQEVFKFTSILIFGGFLLSLYGIYQYLWGFKQLREQVEEMQLALPVVSRVFAIFSNPNSLACLLLLLLPFSFFSFFEEKSRIKKTFFGISTVFMLTCFFFTYSRVGFFASLILFLILFTGIFTSGQGEKIKFFLGFFALSFVLGLFLHLAFLKLSSQVGVYGKAIVTGLVGSAAGRLNLWRGTFKIINFNPLLGTGINTFSSIYPFYEFGSFYSKYAHNTFFQVFSETGFLGFLSLVGLFFLILKHQWGLFFERTMKRKNFGLATFATTCAFIVQNFFDYHWYVPVVTLTFWSLIGLSFSEAIVGKDRVVERRVKSKVIPTLFFAFLILVALSLMIGYFYGEIGKDFLTKGEVEGITYLEKAVIFAPFSARNHSRLSEGYRLKATLEPNSIQKKKLYKKALVEAKKAVFWEPYWSEFHAKLASLYGELKEEEKATFHFKRAINFYPSNPLYPFLLGDFFLKEKKFFEAAKFFQKTLKYLKYYQPALTDGKITRKFVKENNDPLTVIEKGYLGLGEAYFRQGDLEKSLEVYNKLILLSSKNPWAYAKRGLLFREKKMYKEAIFDFKKAIKIEGRNANFHFWLAKTYHDNSKIKLAKVELRKTLALNPRHEQAKKLLLKLEKGEKK